MKGARYIPLFVDLESELGTPAQYLYALAGRESRWNPRKVATIKGEATAAEVRGHAVGLFQLTHKVVTGYNEKHGTNYRKRNMLDGKLNARVAAWYLASPQLTRFATDWKDAREVAVVTQAWNSGPGASWRVLDTLRTRGVDRPTVDDIKAAAQPIVKRGAEFAGLQSKAYRFLASRKTKWAKGVARATLQAFADPNFTKPAPVGRVAAGLHRLFPWRWPWCLHQ